MLTKEKIHELVKIEERLANGGYAPPVYFFDIAQTAIDALERVEELEGFVRGIGDGTAFSKETGLIWEHWIENAKKLAP